MKTITFYGRIIGKDDEKAPQIIIKDVNGKKHKVPILSGMDLEADFTIGEELKICYSVIPHEILVQRRQEIAEDIETIQEALKPTTDVVCLLGVPDEVRGKDAVCQGCNSLKERSTGAGQEAYCELTEIQKETTEPEQQEAPVESA